jgi:flagellar basal body-associated protein FliL
VQLEFVGTVVPTSFVRNQVVVRDGLIALMSRKKAEELGSSKGRENLKTEIRELINEVLKREEIKRVFFTQFVIQ